MARFLFLFCGVLATLFAVEMLKPVRGRHQPFTGLLATISTAVILPFDDTVIAQGLCGTPLPGLRSQSKRAVTEWKQHVLIAGIVAFPASLKNKAIAILAASFLQALNIVRIISLFYLGQWDYTVFEWFHLYLWPVLIMLDVSSSLRFICNGWASRTRKRRWTQPNADASPICADAYFNADHFWHLARRAAVLGTCSVDLRCVDGTAYPAVLDLRDQGHRYGCPHTIWCREGRHRSGRWQPDELRNTRPSPTALRSMPRY